MQTKKINALVALLTTHYAAMGWTIISRPTDGGWEVGSLGAPANCEELFVFTDDGSVTWAGEQQAGEGRSPALDLAIRRVCGWSTRRVEFDYGGQRYAASIDADGLYRCERFVECRWHEYRLTKLVEDIRTGLCSSVDVDPDLTARWVAAIHEIEPPGTALAEMERTRARLGLA